MGRAKDVIINRYGGFRVGEDAEKFAARAAEIDKTEAQLTATRGGTEEELEALQRKLCDLKGISFDDDDEEQW